MPSRRTLKAAAAIREVVSMAILTDLHDPRVRDVTVLSVEVAPDMRQAKVHVSIMGSETKQNLCLRGLQNSAGFLQSKIAKRIDTRYTPKLIFVNDLGVKKSIEISEILHRVLPDDPNEPDQDDSITEAGDDSDDTEFAHDDESAGPNSADPNDDAEEK